MPVQRKLQSAALQIRHAINFVLLKQPRRQRRWSEARVSRRHAEEKYLLPAGKNARTQNLWKQFCKPGSASKDKPFRLDALARVRGHKRNRSLTARLCDLRRAI